MNDIFLSRLAHLYGSRADVIISRFSQDRVPTFRINTLRISLTDCELSLQQEGFVFEKSELLATGYILHNRSKRELTESSAYKNGWIYIQSFSSMLPIEEFSRSMPSLSSPVRALDMCAAPGSKTTQLAAVIHTTGEITAIDSSRDRFFILTRALRLYGATNVHVRLGHAEKLWRSYGPVFDFVLLDAPCSGEGRFSASELALSDDWSLKKVERLAALQKQLIFSAVMCLKPGGILIYSTCTMAPEENEAVIHFALEKFAGAIEVEPLAICGFEQDVFLPGVDHWEGALYDSRVRNSLRVIPDTLWEGFFVCKLRRN
jgi:16S rRNA (cytosine1407-C5)-methyltransferase